MHQKDYSIIERSNLSNVPTLVINQTDIEKQETKKISSNQCWIDTSTRGLSISRNLAIKNATADICVIADDDEIFEENFIKKVEETYKQLPQADIIIFSLSNSKVKFGKVPRKLTKWELLKVISIRISFKIDPILKNNILFDPLLGSGSGNGSGEENKFLLDCYNKGLQIYFSPCQIAYLNKNSESLWFKGFDEKYFYTRGKSTRYIFGFWFACIYGIYFLIAKYNKYKNNISIFKAAFYLGKGLFKIENN